jgi:hypothetical protein
MRREVLFSLLLAFSFVGLVSAEAQLSTVKIPAGSAQEKAFQAASAETDPQKRMAMLQAALEQFASDSQAVTYADWQIAQQYLDQGDLGKALEFGKKAADGQPNNLDILVFVAGVAQKAKARDVILECAARGGAAFNGIASQPKPEGMSAELYEYRVKQDQDPARPAYEYLEASAMNAIVDEQNSAKRIAYVEKYIVAFPNSRFQDQVTQLALEALVKLKDPARMNSFSQKLLGANPNSISTLVLLSDAYADNPEAGSVSRAEGYARKAIDLTKTKPASDPTQGQLYNGLAHSALGYALLKEEKSALAIPELKTACELLKDNADAHSAAMYRLGFAYAKTPGHLAEARTTLTELAAIQGPYQQPARDLLGKVQAAANTKAPARAKK